MQHAFLEHFFAVTARLRPKIAYFHVFSSTSTNEDEFLFHCLNLDIFLRNSTPGWFAYIYKQSKPVGIIAMKFQRTRSHFLVVTFSPPLPSWYLKLSDDLVTNLQCLYVFMTCFKTSFSLMAKKKNQVLKLNKVNKLNKFVYFVTLYCNNFRSSSCVSCIDLSSCSVPLLNFFLVINYFTFSAAYLD